MARDEHDWVGIIVFVLAVTVAVSFIIGVVTLALSPAPFAGDSAKAISAGFAGLIGIVGGYIVGIKRGKSDRGSE